MKKFLNYLCEKEIIDLSDPIHNSDEYLYSNSEPMSYYASGKGFDLTDNQKLYQVVKMVKDLVDRKFYVQNLSYKIDIKDRVANFSFIINDGEEGSDDFFVDSIMQYIYSTILKTFGPDSFEIDKSYARNVEHKKVTRLTVKEKERAK